MCVCVCVCVYVYTSVQSLSHVWLFVIPWTAARQASLSIINSPGLLKLMSIESVMPSNHLIFCCPLLLLPSIFPSIRIFSNESGLHIRWPKYRSFNFSISPSNKYSGLISFRMNWFDLLAIQGALKSLLQYHSSKASILQRSAFFFIVQLSHPYMTTGKAIALTRWTFVDKVMSLCFYIYIYIYTHTHIKYKAYIYIYFKIMMWESRTSWIWQYWAVIYAHIQFFKNPWSSDCVMPF